MGKSKKVTIGYRYYFSLHMGIGIGPLDELVEIKVGDRTAWSGSVTASSTVSINAPNLFGGDKGEGGIQGTLDVMMGEPTQGVNARIAAMMGGIVPAFRHKATLFYDGLVCSLNPYPKPWKMRVRRALKGWDGTTWLPAYAVIPMAGGTIKAMNPAHMLVEGATNRNWGRGLDIGKLNLASYEAAAIKLYNEGFGLCFRWTRQGKITEFLQTVLDHIGGVQDIDRTTGLLTLKLIRDDYSPDALPTFTYANGLLKVEDLEASAIDNSTNTLAVKYRDPVTGEDRTCPPVENLAAVQASGGINATTVEYFGIPTLDLASRVAIRDLQASMGTIRRVRVHLDRRGKDLVPGSVFRISVPSIGIQNLVLRVGKMEDGTITDGAITLICLEDVFGLPSTSYVEPQPPGWVPPDRVARDITSKALYEVSYRDLYRRIDPANLQLIATSAAYVASAARKPQGLGLNYTLWTSLSSGSNYAEREAGDWTPSGAIGTALPGTGASVTVSLTDFNNLEDVAVGTAARMNGEEFVVEAINPTLAQVTLGRACQDTIPLQHASGSRIWFYEDATAEDPTAYLQGDTVYARLLTHTSAQDLALGSASTVSAVMVGRQGRPYPPGNVSINGVPVDYTVHVEGVLSLAYAHRDRITQADTLVKHTQGSIGPEAGVTYTLIVRTAGGSIVRSITGITGASWNYPTDQFAADGHLQSLILSLKSVRGGINSAWEYNITVERHGFGFRFGQDFGGIA